MTAAGLTTALGVLGLAAPAAHAAPAATATTPAALVSESRAIAQAKSSGSAVAVTAATSATETETANPNGTLTLTQTAQPVRKLVAGVWRDLDATLVATGDGRIAPTTAVGDLHLSAGGTGPVATMAGGGSALGLTLPFALPAPTLSGPTATYPNVLSGVDLVVTANTQGGFSEVLVVKDAAAAANPQLKALTLATSTQGLTLTSDPAGNIRGTDVLHHTVAVAPTPTMWDSTAPAPVPATVTDSASGIKLDATTGLAATSSTQTPGEAANVAPLGVAVTSTAITLTPSSTMLAKTGLTWPVYIDPTWSWGAATNGWAVVAKANPDTNYWMNSPSNQNDMQSGLNPDVSGDLRRTLINFHIDGSKVNSTATIYTATMDITETWAYNCTASLVDVYGANGRAVGSSNATWNTWSGVSMTYNDQKNVAHGYSSSCAAAGVGFDVSTSIKSDAGSNTTYQTFMIRADNEASASGWKRWDAATPKLSITYDHTPNQPTGLRTSPTTACTGSTVGDADLKLYATVSDPDGGTVSENFTVWKDSAPSVVDPNSQITNVPSGSNSSPFTVTEAWLKTNSSGTATKFDWKLSATQNSLTSSPSGVCSFTFDPNKPGNVPNVPAPAGATIGQPVSIHISYTKSSSTDTPPASYEYQLNAAGIATVTADASGNATITVKPTRTTNGLLVYGVSAGGNVSDKSAYTPFNAAPGAAAADGDLDGDGYPDLVTVGGVNNLPAGVWLAPGTRSGSPSVNPAANNIGANGNGTGHNGKTTNDPAGFTGAQIITGRFTNSSGVQGLLYYYPADGTGGVLGGSGDGSAIDPNQDDAQHTFTADALGELDWTTFTNTSPSMIANAGDAAAAHSGFTDLIGINGSASSGYHLDYWINGGSPSYWNAAAPLTTASPDGTMDWTAWTITTAQLASGALDMYLWNSSTGALYLWSNLAFTTDGVNNTLTYTSHTLANGSTTTFNKGAAVTLRAGDINHDGTPDLWTVGTSSGNPVTTSWINTGTAMTTGTTQNLVSSNHTWLLHEGPAAGQASNAPVTTALDSGPNPLNGTASSTGVAWNNGGLFDPDMTFTGSASGRITAGTATTHPISTTASFTVSVWAKPAGPNQYVLSQDGTTEAGFALFVGSDGLWRFGMPETESSTATWDNVATVGSPAVYGVWQHVTATYSSTDNTMALYVNGNSAGVNTHAKLWAANGSFQIGDYLHGGTHTGYYTGELANVQTWNQALTPGAAAALSGTPGYIYFPSDGIAYNPGTTWTSPCSVMTFGQGQLSIQETCRGKANAPVTFGTTGYPNAILVLQTDGNLVIYKTSDRSATNYTWKTATSGHPDDGMFLQPDGNLVLHSPTGAVLWASGTNNK